MARGGGGAYRAEAVKGPYDGGGGGA